MDSGGIGPQMPRAQRLYGAVVYWLCIVATVLCTVGPVLSLLFPERNVLNPYYLFSTIWKGAKPAEVWEQVAGGFPGGHFWVNNLASFDGLIQLGLVVGCACTFFALIPTAVSYLRGKPREVGWAIVAIVIVVQVVLAAVGIYSAAAA
jgi:hypothetical protein